MSNDGTGLRERLEALATAMYADGDEWNAYDLLMDAAAALSAVAPPPVLEDAWKPSGVEYDRSIHHNPDASAWADFFVATFPGQVAQHDLMRGWFANAMMAMHDWLKTQAASPAAPAQPEDEDADLLDDVANALANYSLLQKSTDPVGHQLTMALRDQFRAYRDTRPAPAQPEGGDAVGADNVVINLARDVRNATLLLEGGELTEVAAANILHQLANDYENAALRRQHEARPAPAQQAATDEMRLNWLLARCTVDWSGVSIPCGLSRAGDPAESRAAIDAALASNAAASAADAQEGVDEA